MSATHKAIVTVGIKKPLEEHAVETQRPTGAEVQLRVEWTTATPLDLHQADGGMFVTHPGVLGGGASGRVVAVGPAVAHLAVGDHVFAYGFGENKQRSNQQIAVIPEHQCAKIPEGFSPAEAVTIPSNFITVLNTLYRNFHIEVPWPKPAGYVPPHADEPFFVWGGSSSVGLYTIQVLKYYGYKHILAASSKQHHAHLKELGATATFDYRAADVTKQIAAAARQIKPSAPSIPFVIDCIGSVEGTLKPISEFTEAGAQVAAMLPIIVRHADDATVPEFAMDPAQTNAWKQGVIATGVRTHFFAENAWLKENGMTVVMPAMWKQGIIRSNPVRVVEGASMLEKAEKSLTLLRNGEVSGEKLVFRVSQ